MGTWGTEEKADVSKQLVALISVTFAVVALLVFLSLRPHRGAPTQGAAVPRADDKNRVEVNVTEKGFEPPRVHVDAGKLVTLVVTRTSDKRCGDNLIVEGISVKLPLPLYAPVSVTFQPPKSGELRYGCDQEMKVSGVLVVD